MATVNKIFKPRRGKKSTMAGTKANTVLAAGELFLETPDTGVGKGASKIKIGDGSTKYSSLPYALGDTTNDVITYSSNSSTSVATALNNVASGKKLGVMIAGLKQAVSLLNTSVTSLNDDITEVKTSFQDGCSKIASKITSLGVTTASNASIDTIVNNIESLYNKGINSGGKVYNLGKGTSFNIKTLLPDIDYTSLTADNFVIIATSVNASTSTWAHAHTSVSGSGSTSPTCSYNNSSGVLTVSKLGGSFNVYPSNSAASTSFSLNGYNILLIIGEIISLS